MWVELPNNSFDIKYLKLHLHLDDMAKSKYLLLDIAVKLLVGLDYDVCMHCIFSFKNEKRFDREQNTFKFFDFYILHNT